MLFRSQKKTTIGLALPLPWSCDITIKKGLFYEEFRQTLYHEYLHCLGYSHTVNPNDLMFPTLGVGWVTEDNILKYARDAAKHKGLWKSSKN